MYFLIATHLFFYLLHGDSLVELVPIFSVLCIQSRNTVMSDVKYVHPRLWLKDKEFLYGVAGINTSLWNHHTLTVKNSFT